MARGFALYDANDFDRMIEEYRPDEVIVLTPDHTHDEYICRAMEHGCDVIAEKPLTTSIEKLQRIIDAHAQDRAQLPRHLQLPLCAMEHHDQAGHPDRRAGKVASVTRRHAFGQTRGAEFYHRWHGQMDRSGGMLVHKSTHYLDLINFWIASVPRTVYARGHRNVFNEKTAQDMGILDPRASVAATARRPRHAPSIATTARRAKPLRPSKRAASSRATTATSACSATISTFRTPTTSWWNTRTGRS